MSTSSPFSFVKKHDKEDQRKTVCDEWSHQTGIGQATDWITILHQPNSRIRCPHVCLTKRHFVQGLTHYSVHVRRTHGLNAKSQKDKEPTAGVWRFPKHLVPIIVLIIFLIISFSSPIRLACWLVDRLLTSFKYIQLGWVSLQNNWKFASQTMTALHTGDCDAGNTIEYIQQKTNQERFWFKRTVQKTQSLLIQC